MYFGKIDIVVTARGLIIPSGEEKVVQSLNKGVAITISVKEDEYVTKDQIAAIVSPAEHESGLELNNIKEEEARVSEQLASDRSKYRIALDNKNCLSSVRDIISSYKYDEVSKEATELSHEIGALLAFLAEIRNKRAQLEKQNKC